MKNNAFIHTLHGMETYKGLQAPLWPNRIRRFLNNFTLLKWGIKANFENKIKTIFFKNNLL